MVRNIGAGVGGGVKFKFMFCLFGGGEMLLIGHCRTLKAFFYSLHLTNGNSFAYPHKHSFYAW